MLAWFVWLLGGLNSMHIVFWGHLYQQDRSNHMSGRLRRRILCCSAQCHLLLCYCLHSMFQGFLCQYHRFVCMLAVRRWNIWKCDRSVSMSGKMFHWHLLLCSQRHLLCTLCFMLSWFLCSHHRFVCMLWVSSRYIYQCIWGHCLSNLCHW